MALPTTPFLCSDSDLEQESRRVSGDPPISEALTIKNAAEKW
jgi:hypothetical protein